MRSIPLVSYPPEEVRSCIPLFEWASCIELWLLVTRRLLSLPANRFAEALQTSSEATVVPFLVSFVKNSPVNLNGETVDVSDLELRRFCFLLLHRTLSIITPVPKELREPAVLARACRLYPNARPLEELVDSILAQEVDRDPKALQECKVTLVESLISTDFSGKVQDTIALAKVSPAYRHSLLSGSDFLDALSDAYQNQIPSGKPDELVMLAYICLVEPLDSTPPRTSLLMDHLYNIQTTSLMKKLVEITPFLTQFRHFVEVQCPSSGRAKSLLETLSSLERMSTTSTGSLKPLLSDKGKGRADASQQDEVGEASQVHQMSLISQIEDLFPDLDSAFIAGLLDLNGNDVERVTASLLDKDLAASVDDTDEAEIHKPQESSQQHNVGSTALNSSYVPISSMMPLRRNVFDGDEIDRMSAHTSRLHIGKRDKHLTADDLLANQRPATQKEEVLSALAAFDSDEDEHDDTYDVNDVGRGLDSALAESDEEAAGTGRDRVERILFNAYKTHPQMFSRDALTRRGQARAALKSETAMTDEAIEGFAVMMQRDPKRLQRLERSDDIDKGIQTQILEKSAWQADSSQEDFALANGTEKTGFRRRTIHQGRGRASRFDDSTEDRSTHAARQRKDAHKASRANHNRRDQRARKLARGGGFGS